METQQIKTFRRLLPQILVAMVKNLIIFSKSLFDAFPSIVIPSLLGISVALNPDETIRITAVQASWLSSFVFVGHPFGSVLSGVLSDAIGRKRAMMMVIIPAAATFIVMSFADSFVTLCLGFVVLGFVYGLQDAPTNVYISEVSEPSIRGTLLSMSPIAHSLGRLTIFSLASLLSWRKVSLICAAVPCCIAAAICFVPESPNWLLSKSRPKDAQKSLQWLRGWVSSETVRDEFENLQNHSVVSTACVACTEQSIHCYHPKAKFCDKMKELKRKSTLKPLILVICLDIFMEICVVLVWQPFIIQVVKAYGMPLDANLTTVIWSSVAFVGSVCFMFSVKAVGKRRLYLISTCSLVLCSFGLSIYGFVFFPPNWTSFKNPSDPTIPNFESIRDIVGNYGYLALILLLVMEYSNRMGLNVLPIVVQAEVFSFKLRSFLCGVTLAGRSAFASLVAKTYYDVEIWLTLPGAVLFYGILTSIGWIIMYFILPETEGRSLEDIETHYSDNTKKITDINIRINSRRNQ